MGIMGQGKSIHDIFIHSNLFDLGSFFNFDFRLDWCPFWLLVCSGLTTTTTRITPSSLCCSLRIYVSRALVAWTHATVMSQPSRCQSTSSSSINFQPLTGWLTHPYVQGHVIYNSCFGFFLLIDRSTDRLETQWQEGGEVMEKPPWWWPRDWKSKTHIRTFLMRTTNPGRLYPLICDHYLIFPSTVIDYCINHDDRAWVGKRWPFSVCE